MHSPKSLPLDAGPLAQPRGGEALVQDRPTLGSMPIARRGAERWVLPLVDLLCASVALGLIAALAGISPFPALPIAPLVLVFACGLLGIYGARPEEGAGWSVIRLLLAALFAWSSSLLISLQGSQQLALWLCFVALDLASRTLCQPLLARLRSAERWVLVGDEQTAERLRAYAPLRDYATLVATVTATGEGAAQGGRVAALDIVDRYHADRVVISSQRADDEGLLELVRAFKSIGVPVSLLPRPLDLLEAQSVSASRIGGVPLIEVGALGAHGSLPYSGPDRRRSRHSRVSVVVPAMNEARNIGHVLEALPGGLHEVILVDGNSHDETIAVARRACPGIKVICQGGRGKGDALRAGFAAVSGNLVVMLDADGSADPAEIPRFVAALEAGADFAKGSRFLPGGGSEDITAMRKLGNGVLSGTANLLHGTRFTDLCYGYNAFWARCLPFISLDVPGFEVETLINLRIAAAGMKITEVPSYEKERLSGQSNLKTFRDGFRVLGTILREARRRRGIQLASSPHRQTAETRPAPAAARAVKG